MGLEANLGDLLDLFFTLAFVGLLCMLMALWADTRKDEEQRRREMMKRQKDKH